MLFYERVKKKPIKLIVSPSKYEELKDSLESSAFGEETVVAEG